MKLLKELNEAASDGFDTKEAAYAYINKKRDPEEYLVVKHKKTGKFFARGHMAWSQWSQADKDQYVHVAEGKKK